MIGLVDIRARHDRLADQVEEAVLEVLRGGRYIGGPVVAEAEAALGRAFRATHTIGCGSGTEALVLALKALDLGPGSRVAVPALSFFATVEAILWVGAEPVFVDVLPERPLLDASAVPTDVDACVAVHLFGHLAPVPTHVPVIDDACQALGWEHDLPGDLAALSLYPTKNVGVAGDAGAVFTQDPALAERVRGLGNHGLLGPHHHGSLGTTSRLDPLQAAVLLVHLRDLDRRVARRSAIAARYDHELAGLNPLLRARGDVVHQYVVRHPERDALAAVLHAAGIGSSVYYPWPMDVQPTITGRPPDLEASSCPNAVSYCRACLALPCHAELSDAQVDHVIVTAQGFLG